MTDCIVDPSTAEWGPHPRFDGARVLPLITPAHGSGLTVSRVRLEPGAGIPAHDHPDSIETFYILSGTATCIVGSDETEMRPGSIGFAPVGVSHSIGNRGSETLEALTIFSPRP